jgi:hypothetical protein
VIASLNTSPDTVVSGTARLMREQGLGVKQGLDVKKEQE